MQFTLTTKMLTHAATLAALSAGVKKAEEIGVPQVIVLVDASGELLGEIRMTGARFLSRKSALSKAQTAASIGKPSGSVAEAVHLKVAHATGGRMTSLPGGLPIRIDGALLGGIGVGSGTGEQDVIVATAALAAIGAETEF